MWRVYVPGEGDVPTAAVMIDAGFPSRLVYADVAQVRASAEWAAAIAWWDNLEEHLKLPRGLAMWETNMAAALSLTLLAKRLMCWKGLPVPRGVRVGNVQYVEAGNLMNADRFEATAHAGVLVVGGVGVVEYGVDRTVEALCALAQMRKRDGALTFWHLEPAGTQRSVNVCTTLIEYLGDGCVVAGMGPADVG